MGQKTRSFLKNGNRDFNNVLDSMMNLTDGGTITGATTFSGNTILSGTSNVANGVDLTPNDVATTALGLNPTWRLNFGGATLAAGANTTDVHLIDVLTPMNTLLRMSLALQKVASQGTAVTAAQAGQIFGATSTVGAVIDMTGVTAVTTNFVPATLKVNTITGTTAANITMNDSATDLAADLDQSLILFNNYVIEDTHVVNIGLHANNKLLAASNEVVTSAVTATDQLTRPTAASNSDTNITLTVSGGDTTILPGSFLYLQAGAASNSMALKGCIRTTGGIITAAYTA